MNRRQFFAVTLLPVVASMAGAKVFARVPHIAVIAADGSLVARSEELPAGVCEWLRKPDRVAEYSTKLLYEADRDIEVSHFELRDLDADPRVGRRKEANPRFLMHPRDRLDLTWEWKGWAL